jgi:hypothetical protein
MGGEFIPSLEEGDFAVDTEFYREVILLQRLKVPKKLLIS